ncbi:hypothetical protein J7L70_00030 [Candidatus Bathyarchaeota archaeon]|nr:hypothetical protein [Candidatus Bathyarchaeota archaeon]
MGVWLFSSKDVCNIRRGFERLIWGFWDRDAGEKQRRNWRSFIRLFNQIRPFDLVVFQVAKTGDIHGLGIVRYSYYDDQTPVWDAELEEGRVLYPWRVRLSFMMFSETPVVSRFIPVQDYIDGYGAGSFPKHEVDGVLAAFMEASGVMYRVAFD